jgi:hypothetical protein
MSLKKIISSAVVSAVAAGSLLPLSTAASAGEWNHSGRGHGYTSGQRIQNNLGGDRHEGRWNQHRQYNAWNHNDGDEGGYRRHRNHNGRNIAIGAFAAILGLAIASEASRGHGHSYDND